MLLDRQRTRGLTLLELLAGLAAAAIIAGIGAPAMRALVLDGRRTATANAFVASAQLARSTAVRRQLPVVICAGTRPEACEAGRAGWARGWFVFVNADRDWPPRLDEGEQVLHEYAAGPTPRITANRAAFRFNRIGLRTTNGTLTLCDERGGRHARALIVSYTGRVRASSTRADGSEIAC